MSKLKIEFGFGTDLASDGTPVRPDQRWLGVPVIRARAVELFGGCTLTSTLGDWLDPDTNRVVSEAGMTLSVLTDLPPVLLAERVNALANCIKKELDQKAVAVTHYGVNFEII